MCSRRASGDSPQPHLRLAPVRRDLASFLLAVPQDPPFPAVCDAHLRELVDRYGPDVLWNDIAMPAAVDLDSLFAHYYEAVPEGVVNDRWVQGRLGGSTVATILRGVSWGLEKAWPVIPARYKSLELSGKPEDPARAARPDASGPGNRSRGNRSRGGPLRPRHLDFTTPEYAQHRGIVSRKWEATRGVGHSFGANRNERPADVLTSAELVRSFVDIVSKGGNLLIGIGPEPDGSIPGWQQAPLRGLGEWLSVHGDAIFGTRPWVVAEGRTAEGTPVRFTCSEAMLNVVLTEGPPSRTVTLWGVDGRGVSDVEVPGIDATTWNLDEGNHVVVNLPERFAPVPALSIRLECEDPMAIHTS